MYTKKVWVIGLFVFISGCIMDTPPETSVIRQAIDLSEINYLSDFEKGVKCKKIVQRTRYKISPTTAGQLVECDSKDGPGYTYEDPKDCAANWYEYAESYPSWTNIDNAPDVDPNGDFAIVVVTENQLVYACDDDD